MDYFSKRVPYLQTNYLNKIVLDYIDQNPALDSLYSFSPSLSGLKKALDNRKKKSVNRKVLVDELRNQYKNVEISDAVHRNIELLLSDKTFTIATAHQPNLFTGPLYVIYKIVHAIKLADFCKTTFSENNFVPVLFLGTEDADLEELNHIYLCGDKLVWNTKQKGAVGRMKVDESLIQLIDLMEGQLSVEPFGTILIDLLRKSYLLNASIEAATFSFIHSLFADFGLIVLLPDNAVLKKEMIAVFEDELLNQSASVLVNKATERILEKGYKLQVQPREINLFYLQCDIRERILKQGNKFTVQNTAISFSKDELLNELKTFPEKFSPNVILRGLYQETILPNIVFIGGGGELAYWLQFKDLFDNFQVFFPALILRNSFLIAEEKWDKKIAKLDFNAEDFFAQASELIKRRVAQLSTLNIKLTEHHSTVEDLFKQIKKQVEPVSASLLQHVDALEKKNLKQLLALEKKLMRAERRKYVEVQRQIETIKNHLFPNNGLQERHENSMYYVAKFGKDFIQQLYNHSLTVEQEFAILFL